MSDRTAFFGALALTVFAGLMTGWNIYAVTVTTGSLQLVMMLCVMITLISTVVGCVNWVPTTYRWMRLDDEHRKQHPTP